jgi:YHS domain-containing protein
MVRDPVCGLEIDPQSAAARAMYNGVAYYFCSLGCKDRFVVAPDLYAQRAAASEASHPESVDATDEGDRPVVTHGVDVIEGHEPGAIQRDADDMERDEPRGSAY